MTEDDRREDRLELTVPEQMAGLRLDAALARLLPEFSRSRLQQWIREGGVTLDGAVPRQRDRMAGGERVVLRARMDADQDHSPEAIALDIMHEDDAILVINKPPGIVVHPGAGNRTGTLLNALLHHAPEVAQVPRGGIVHRLDKETSGVMVVARTLAAHTHLVAQIHNREVSREYLALVQGRLVSGGTVEGNIGRHPRHRTRMAVVPGGKSAVTHYRISRWFPHHTLLKVLLETGRTHQIRVHMAHIRHPVVGDPVYGGRLGIPSGASPELVRALRGFRRQALHAARLELRHPRSGELVSWQAAMPADMAALVEVLAADAAARDEP